MSAPMESMLSGYQDPRLSAYFVPVNGIDQYHGIRQGIKIISKEQYAGFSQIARLDKRITFMTVAEAWLLKAEAALQGWRGAGNAAQNYNNGITASFQQYGLPNVNDYLQNSTLKAKPYTDPRNFENNIPAGSPYLSTITIKWEEAASPKQNWNASLPKNGSPCSQRGRKPGASSAVRVIRNCFR
nr:SusD/RagB family nutrient-binding outer membrane lipoprotein [Paraflavitalea speifideiaquila]